MPELPEVETVVRDLRPHLVGRRIIGATVRWKRTIALPSAAEFSKQICGFKFTAITRRGKHLIFHLQNKERPKTTKYLIVHLRMTGGFRIDPHDMPRDKHTHVCFLLDNGKELRFRDTRKFGRMWLVDNPERIVGKLGPEPLEMSARDFHRLFETRRGNLKPLLLNQTFIAGIGNIYADESLWYARLHPLRKAESLSHEERARLFRAIRQVLKRSIAVGGTSIDVMYTRVNGASGKFVESLRVFDQEERPCRRCGNLIQKTVVGQRGTHFCPICQKP